MIYEFNKENINSDKLGLEIKSQLNGLVGITFNNGIVSIEFESEIDESLLGYIVTNHDHDSFVPSAISPRQLRIALLERGVSTDMVEYAIDQMSEPLKSKALIEWEYALGFERINPLVTPIATILGYTEAQIDALWIYASTI